MNRITSDQETAGVCLLMAQEFLHREFPEAAKRRDLLKDDFTLDHDLQARKFLSVTTPAVKSLAISKLNIKNLNSIFQLSSDLQSNIQFHHGGWKLNGE